MAVSNDVLSLTGYGQNFRWNREAPLGTPVVLTYSFPQKKNAYDSGDRPGFEGFSEAHVTHIEKALKTWEAAAGVTFVRVPNKVGGEIQLSMFDMTGHLNAVGKQVSGWGYYPQSSQVWNGNRYVTQNNYRGIEGDIYMNATFYADNAATMAPGIRGYMIVLHEIGHVLGFKHPFGGDPTITPSHDNGTYTVMSYDVPHSNTRLGRVDVEAMQMVYGNSGYQAKWNAKAQAVEQTGTTAGQWHLGSPLRDIVDAKAGNDTIRTKGGKDRIFDGPGNDKVDAGAGDDFIRAGTGQDLFRGGTGWDMLSYEDSSRKIHLDLAEGTASLGAKGDKLRDIEGIRATMFNDQVNGNGARNTLIGRNGDDVLSGAGNRDVLQGDAGNDTLSGGKGDDRLFGGPGADTLLGGDGRDRLHGGQGPDQLTGGESHDVFVFDRTSDKDRILDFKDHIDTINLKGMGFDSVSDALAKAQQVGNNVVFTFKAPLKLTVENVTIAELSDDILV